VPFLRVIRDKRGYETTYLMHWYREGGRQHSRILYVFRTPGGVRVGREPLEPDILRQLEREYPDIDFDWKVVVDNQQVIEAAAEPRRPRRRRREDEGEPAADAVAEPEPATAAAVAVAVVARPAIPSAIEGATPDEQMAFLAGWYPQVRERIGQRAAADPARLDALLALAERLNPAAWTDADQITAGLQGAAEALERLSRIFAKRRRRARKPRRDPSGGEPAPPADAAPPPADA
jgi:hypothetical protein